MRSPPTPTIAALAIVAALFPKVDARAEDEAGRRIFLEGGGGLPACAVCHTLADAGSAGQIGPNLDTLAPDLARVRAAVHDGVGVMPAFGQALTETEVEAVSAYVARAAAE
ncbi:MAG: c-type cytochrome [Paracoccaceae bacterium]